MTPRSLALALGLVYLGLGALGLMPGALAGFFPVDPGLALMPLDGPNVWLHLATAAGFVAWRREPVATERRHGT